MGAMDWIKVEVNLPEKPEVAAIAASLNLDEDAVVGKLIRIWTWVDQHLTDGNAPGVTKAFLDRLAYAPGFADQMIRVGWLEVTRDGLAIPEFGKHFSKTAKKRALTAKRVSGHRAKSNADQPLNSVTAALQKSATEQEQEEEQEEEEEKEREQEEETPCKSPTGDATESKPDRFADRIRQVLDHYRTHHPRANVALKANSGEYKKIKSRLIEDFSVEDLCLAIDGNHISPFHRGENEDRTKHHGLKVIFRDADQVNKFIALARDGPPRSLSPQTQRTLRAVEEFTNTRLPEDFEP